MTSSSKLIGQTPRPLVSIVTPAFICARYLAETMRSVAGQTFGDWEHLIVDNNSTDGSAALARDLSSGDLRVRVLGNSTSKGAAVTRNVGIEAASGRYIFFLDVDDLWLPLKLERQLAQDYLMWMTIARIAAAHGWKIGGLDEVHAQYRIHDEQRSRNKIRMIRGYHRIVSEDLGYGPVIGGALTGLYAVNGILDRTLRRGAGVRP